MNIRRLIKKVYLESLQVPGGTRMDERILGDALEAMQESRAAELAALKPNIGRIIMRSKITKLGTAALIAVVAALLISYIGRFTSPAYAITQTIEASRQLRHVYFEYLSGDGVTKDAWLEYDERGQIKKVRVNIYKRDTGDLGTAVVWQDGKTQSWNKGPRELLLFQDEGYTARILWFVHRHDPVRAVEYMYKLQEKGEVKVEIQDSANKAEPVIVRARYGRNTYLIDATTPEMQEVFLIDPTSKLIKEIEVYKVDGGELTKLGVWRYGKYDEPLDAEVFDLEGKVPADVKRVDMMALDLGLEFEDTNLSKEEIAVRTVRAFFETLIEKNYDKSLKIWGDYHTDRNAKIRKMFEKWNVVRITSIDTPVEPPTWQFGTVALPCTVECEKDGQTVQTQVKTTVYCVLGHPNRRFVRVEFGRP